MKKTGILSAVLTLALAAAPLGSVTAFATEQDSTASYIVYETDSEVSDTESGAASVLDPSAAVLTVKTMSTVSGTCGTNVKWMLNTGTGVLTISGKGKMTNYTYGCIGVTPAPWDDYRDQIKTVKIKSGVTSIGNYAFIETKNLTSVTIASSVKTIGTSAFQWCAKLKTVKLSGVTKIGDAAFRECTKLKTVTLGNKLKTVGNMAFYKCTALKSITIPKKVTKLGSSAFGYCTKLTSVTFKGKKFKTVGTSAFQYCSALKSIVLPVSTKTISDSAFYECTALKSITIPKNVKKVGSYAFGSCSALTAVTFNGSAPKINSAAFDGVTAAVSYPASDTSWTSSKLKNYGGKLTWETV